MTQVRKSGNLLWLTFRGHSVSFPITEKGIELFLSVLTQIEVGPSAPKIGTKAEPVQHMIELWLRQGNKVKKKKAKETLSLEDLEL